MCGIAGILSYSKSKDQSFKDMSSMLYKIKHRGPDDRGIWFESGLCLGHQRLSIVDLSPAGHQPMESATSRYVIAYNGEIYNYQELKKTLENQAGSPKNGWRGHSDTEILLAGFEHWGIEETLKKSIGMFALALWDKKEKSLFLTRDRIGEKPLYYGWQKNSFLFASELKALLAHPDFERIIDNDAIIDYLRWNYIKAPLSIYKNIFKLMPGTYLEIKQSNIINQTIPTLKAYWSLNDAAIAGAESPFTGSYEEAVTNLEQLIKESVRMQSMADVPVGAFLSGGVDSSLVVTMMQQQTCLKVNTFSIGMPDKKFDESKHAAHVASYLGTNHTEYRLSPKDALEIIPSLSEVWDEPFADSSQIPTFLVSKLAKEKVTVALSGDGGDEFFLGYPQYSLIRKLWETRFLRHLPFTYVTSILPKYKKSEKLKKQIKSVVGAWETKDPIKLATYWMDRYRFNNLPINFTQENNEYNSIISSNIELTTALLDAKYYLPDDLMVKVDRASMTHSLETRAPLLDHRIAEFALSLPIEFKVHQKTSKRILRDILYRHVPQKIVDRPKMGFSIPLTEWLRKDLREWANDSLNQLNNKQELFNINEVQAIWNSHLNGADETDKLWGLIMLSSYLKNHE